MAGRGDATCSPLVMDEAGMVGSRQMERVLSAARDAGAKVVLVGDPEQLQAIEAGRHSALSPSGLVAAASPLGCYVPMS